MHAESPSDTQILRFALVVSGSDYQALVVHLTGHRRRRVPFFQPCKELLALVDLHPESETFSITRIGHHKLPKPVLIRSGSTTHRSLQQAISAEITRGSTAIQLPSSLRAQLEQIIGLCPEVSVNTLRAELKDFELRSYPARLPSEAVTIPVLTRLAPSLLLEYDEQPTLVLTEDATFDIAEAKKLVCQGIDSHTDPTVRVSGNCADIQLSFTLPALPPSCAVSFFSHWGSYEDLSPPWLDELITTVEGTGRTQHVSLRFQAHAPIRGWYGLTIYAKVRGSSEALWIGRPWIDDSKFFVDHDELSLNVHESTSAAHEEDARTRVAIALADPSISDDLTYMKSAQATQRALGSLLAEAAYETLDEASTLSRLLDTLRQTDQTDLVDQICATYGLGEVVFASPEFSHAGAGGLAQVLTGLPLELSKSGVPVTIITPLYRHTNGQRHPGAEEILSHGLLVGKERVVPSYVTTVSVSVGPTREPGTAWNKRPPTTVQCKVHKATSGRIQVFLLSAASVFDRLYQPVSPDEQLRRAIIFSRAVLETITTEKLDICPSVILSNDWMTACIPPLVALDPAYRQNTRLAKCKTVHVIHNGGADYHGRLPLVVNGEDLWPMLNLAPEHYFGFRDPHRDDLINLTIAATRHAGGGVLTVSQPYAKQLVSDHCGGDGLDQTLKPRRSQVFGVSNGIKREDIDSFLAATTNLSGSALADTSSLLAAKANIRSNVQQRYGLTVSRSATLLSFVARIAEQKGLQLLSGFVECGSHSTLEDILFRNTDVQILIAGPLTPGDAAARELHNCVSYLTKRYPGRISAVFDYIAHATALEIISASTLFLMPSRFEPGGISQLEALAVGTPVIGRGVGGIAATIENFDPISGQGTGFLCYDYSPKAFANTVHWALSVCKDKGTLKSLVAQSRAARHSWADRAPIFSAVLQRIVLGEERFASLPALAHRKRLSDVASVAEPA